jgi:hypothetical protein
MVRPVNPEGMHTSAGVRGESTPGTGGFGQFPPRAGSAQAKTTAMYAENLNIRF